MKSNPWGGGSAPSIQNMTSLSEWEYSIIESIGRVIGFWGFKENHGRIWSYLYLNGPTTSKDLRNKLGISKGGMSMLLSDLEKWKIIKRVKNKNYRDKNSDESEVVRDGNARIYKAQEDFSSMIVSVLQIREQGLISSTLYSLQEAKKHSHQATDSQQKSLQNMIDFAQGLHHVFDFICTDETSIIKIQQFMSMSKLQKKSSIDPNNSGQNIQE